MAFAIGADGDLLVEQLDGKALRFHLDGPGFIPVFVEEFRTDASTPGSGFDGPDRVLVPQRARPARLRPRRAPADGERSRSATCRSSRSAAPCTSAATAIACCVLDSDRQSLWMFPG